MPKRIQMPCYHSFFLFLVMFFMQQQGKLNRGMSIGRYFLPALRFFNRTQSADGSAGRKGEIF